MTIRQFHASQPAKSTFVELKFSRADRAAFEMSERIYDGSSLFGNVQCTARGGN
jgi:hypothetical protein